MNRKVVFASLCAFAAVAAANAQTIESCVSDDSLHIAAADRHAWLDAGDLQAANAAITQRFPVLGRDGFAPSRLLLWQRPGGAWLYVALLDNPEKADELCFTATISAEALALTKTLLRKYFPGLLEA